MFNLSPWLLILGLLVGWLLLILLVRVGIMQVETLKKGRRYAIVAMFVAAAIMTPPDIISQIGLAVPLILLYEISILIAGWMVRKRDAAAKGQDRAPTYDLKRVVLFFVLPLVLFLIGAALVYYLVLPMAW